MKKYSKPFRLTLAAVKRAGLSAYRRKRLTAQHPNPKFRVCAYTLPQDPQYRCVIGHAFPPALRQRLLRQSTGDNLLPNDLSLIELVRRNFVVMNDRVSERIINIQCAHDTWVGGENTIDGDNARLQFLKVLKG